MLPADCKENLLVASYYFSIFDLSTERCLTNIGLHKICIQPISPSHSYDSEFNIQSKIRKCFNLPLDFRNTFKCFFLVSPYTIKIHAQKYNVETKLLRYAKHDNINIHAFYNPRVSRIFFKFA